MKYIEYKFRNVEPLRIIDDSGSQHGENATLKYIPGSTLRGMFINRLAGKLEDFESIKEKLFSDRVQFLNAYPISGGKAMIPSPKGFYEDKSVSEGKKAIQNVVATGSFDEGLKRASVGSVAYLDGNSLCYSHVRTMSDLKIKINDEKRDVFRNEYICPGYEFLSFIRLDEGIDESIFFRVLDEGFRLGNARTSGLGKCEVTGRKTVSKIPYHEYCAENDSMESECYMFLASDMCMISDIGEPCGINLTLLENKLGVKDLTIKYAATSKKDIRGYNRNWNGKIPSLPVYEKGSVFRLGFTGSIGAESATRLMDEGIGERRNEGFGRVLFLNGYDKIEYKFKVEADRISCDANKRAEVKDRDTLKTVASTYLCNRVKDLIEKKAVSLANKIEGYPGSQLGLVESICVQYYYKPKEAKDALNKYLDHTTEKDARQSAHKVKKSRDKLKEFVEEIKNATDIFTYIGFERTQLMGFSISDLMGTEEAERLKLRLIIDAIRYNNKGEVK